MSHQVRTKNDAGRTSNVALMLFALFLTIGGGAVIFLLLWGAKSPLPEGARELVLAGYSFFGGAFVGAFITAMRHRIVIINWDRDGLTYRIGMLKPARGRWPWSDPISCSLSIRKNEKPRSCPFVLIIRNGSEEIHIDSIQASWRSVVPLVRVLDERTRLARYPYNIALLDQGPSYRLNHPADTDSA